MFRLAHDVFIVHHHTIGSRLTVYLSKANEILLAKKCVTFMTNCLAFECLHPFDHLELLHVQLNTESVLICSDFQLDLRYLLGHLRIIAPIHLLKV